VAAVQQAALRQQSLVVREVSVVTQQVTSALSVVVAPLAAVVSDGETRDVITLNVEGKLSLPFCSSEL
jgi:hypothetical protein